LIARPLRTKFKALAASRMEAQCCFVSLSMLTAASNQTDLLISIVATVPTSLERVTAEELREKKPLQRKAKNFAERLMHVLQDGIGKDTVWWVGEGKALAIHTRNLKEGDLLSEHFRVKDYSVFIRNCNRW
jgi:tRNA pseudouridine-54 N-methylase